MISYRTLTRLANLIQSIAEGEQKTEVIRQVLTEQRFFEPQVAFRRIDQSKSGYITSHDLLHFLESNKILVSHKEIIQLLRSIDLNEDGRVTYTDFSEFILPKENQRLKQIANLRDTYNLQNGQLLPYEVEWSLARVFEQEIKNQRTIENLKDILISSYDFNKLDCFNSLDTARQGYLDMDNIQTFMCDQGKELTQDQLIAFFDKIGTDDKIIYNQFTDLVTPIDPSPQIQQQLQSKKNKKIKKKLYKQINKKIESQYNSPNQEGNEFQQKSMTFTHTSPKKKKQNLPNSLRLAASQRSPYHTPNKILTTGRLQNILSTQINTSQKNNFQRKKYLPGNEEEHLVRALKEQIVIDRDVEDLKNQLALTNDFNVEDAFRIFDKKGKGFINQIEFEISLNDIGIYPTKEEITLFFKRHDRDNDGLIKFSDFQLLLTPFNAEYAVLNKCRIPNFNNPDDGLNNFAVDTRFCFKKFLNKVFQGEVEGEYIRQRISKRPLFSVHDAFQTLDSQQNGFVQIDDLKAILHEYGIFVSTSDLFLLFQRYNKSPNQRISYPEFMNELTPKLQ